MWGIWMTDPPSTPLDRCILLPAEEEAERAAEAWVSRWGYYSVSVMPPEVKAESVTAWDGSSQAVWESSAKIWPPGWRKGICDMMTFSGAYLKLISACLFRMPPKLSLHTFCQGPLTSAHGCRGATWFKLDPEACFYFFLLSLSNPPPTLIAPRICFIFCSGYDSLTRLMFDVLIMQCQWYTGRKMRGLSG